MGSKDQAEFTYTEGIRSPVPGYRFIHRDQLATMDASARQTMVHDILTVLDPERRATYETVWMLTDVDHVDWAAFFWQWLVGAVVAYENEALKRAGTGTTTTEEFLPKMTPKPLADVEKEEAFRLGLQVGLTQPRLAQQFLNPLAGITASPYDLIPPLRSMRQPPLWRR